MFVFYIISDHTDVSIIQHATSNVDACTHYAYLFFEQDACTGVHSACRREENGHNLDICVLRIDIYLSGLLARRQNAWSQDGGNMRVIANGVNR